VVVCPRCGKEIRYIAAPGSPDGKIYAVDPAERRLINEKGRILAGYQEHRCAPEGAERPTEGKTG
jgi:hypothetical protein